MTIETLGSGNGGWKTNLHRIRTSPCSSSRRPHSILLVFHYGFHAAECGFKGMKPWEEEHRRKNEMEGLWVGQKEESVREGGSGLLGFDPS